LRFISFVSDVGKELHKQLDNVRDLAQNVIGGWEVWLQVQIYLRMKKAAGVAEFRREVPYPRGNARCDFVISPSKGSNIWVEPKVQRIADPQQPVNDFIADINKIPKEGFGANDVAGAIVVIPHNAWDALQHFKSRFTDYKKAGYCLVDSGDVTRTVTFSELEPQWSEVNGRVLILYWAVK